MKEKGSFTLPGEAGCEELTLRLAQKWGADVIRDSDGTVLSDEITKAGYGIYSTICIIRDHNEWAKAHPGNLQQTFLMSRPVTASDELLVIHLLDGYFTEQFTVNDTVESISYWEVFDRTSGTKIPKEQWNYEKEAGNVVLQGIIPFHVYTVNFLAFRQWEEISMYNHVTNGWNKEHLVPIDVRSIAAKDYILGWMENWCEKHPDTTVVRFTSLFYNFVWIWGSSERNRNLFSDWGSYDFTVSPKALESFEKEYGYALTSEDFINGGKLHVTHMPPSKKQLDYMRFTNRFVVGLGRELVNIVHRYGKKAYVFCDDSWIGLEPYSDLFKDFDFDGLIKCVFSGYEVRFCSGVDVPVHEIRLHPYLFPVGLGGAPTFSAGGDPVADSQKYWISVRRALLRKCVDRIGLGGYLHLTEDYPDYQDHIEKLADEFRLIKTLNSDGKVYTLPVRIAVLHSWGKLRSWTLSGHFHETSQHVLIHINEALSGLPFDVDFISFDDVKNGALKDYDVVINAGRANSAWSGGERWNDGNLVTMLTKWVYEGGVFIGADEPSAFERADCCFEMAHVLGVDIDTGARVCHGRWSFETDMELHDRIFPEGAHIDGKKDIFLTDGTAKVLAEDKGLPTATVHAFGKGCGIYLAGFEKNNANTRMLMNLILYACGRDKDALYITDNADTECAYYPADGKLVVINNSGSSCHTTVRTEKGTTGYDLAPFETRIEALS